MSWSQAPFVTVWTRPRDTIRYVARRDPTPVVIVIAWLSGVLGVLQTSAMGEGVKPGWGPFIVGMAILLGPLFGFAQFYVAGGIVSWTAGWLGGRSDAESTRMALAWGSVPEVTALILWVPALAFFGEPLFTAQSATLDGRSGGVMLAFVVVQVALYLWSWVLRLGALSEVHRISVGRALGALFLAWLLGLLSMATVLIGLALALGT